MMHVRTEGHTRDSLRVADTFRLRPFTTPVGERPMTTSLTMKTPVLQGDIDRASIDMEGKRHDIPENNNTCVSQAVLSVVLGSWSVRFVGWADWVDCRDSYKRVKGRSHTVEKRKASQPQKPHATSQPSRFSHTPTLSTDPHSTG